MVFQMWTTASLTVKATGEYIDYVAWQNTYTSEEKPTQIEIERIKRKNGEDRRRVAFKSRTNINKMKTHYTKHIRLVSCCSCCCLAARNSYYHSFKPYTLKISEYTRSVWSIFAAAFRIWPRTVLFYHNFLIKKNRKKIIYKRSNVNEHESFSRE